MRITTKKAIAVLVLFTASFGLASCGSDTSSVSSRSSVVTTTADPGPTKAEVDKFTKQIWINRTNERTWNETIWTNQVNHDRWVRETNAKIQAEQARQAKAASSQKSSAPTSSGSGHSDDFLACVRAHESDTAGGYSAQNPSSSASGAYQIVDGTWGNYGGYASAGDAPPHVQDERASQLPRSAWNGSGC